MLSCSSDSQEAKPSQGVGLVTTGLQVGNQKVPQGVRCFIVYIQPCSLFATFSDAVELHNLLLMLARAGGGLGWVWQNLAAQFMGSWDVQWIQQD